MNDLKNNIKKLNRKEIINYLSCSFIFIVIMVAILSFGKNNYKLTHIILENLNVMVGYSIVILALNTYGIVKNKYFMNIGISFIFICFFNALHIISSGSMKIFTNSSYNMELQFDMAVKVFECAALYLSLKSINNKKSFQKILIPYIITTVIVLADIFKLNLFRALYEGSPLFFKTYSTIECMILFTFVCIFIYMNKFKSEFTKLVYITLKFAIFFSCISEIILIFNINSSSFANIISNYFKLLSVFSVYEATVVSTLRRPMDNLFNGLNIKNELLNKQTIELQKSLENFEEGRNKYKNLINFFPEAILVRRDRKVIFANDAAAQLINYKSSQDIIGIDVMTFIHKDYEKHVFSRIESINMPNELPFEEEKIVDTNGNIKTVESKSKKIIFGGEDAVLVVLKDITEKKQFEENEKKLNHLVESEKLKSDFFANLSHELRTPINVIYSALQIMETKNNNTEIDKYIAVIKQNSFRLLKIINNLIDLTKIDAGYYRLNLVNCDIVKVIEDTTMSVCSYVESNRMEIIFDTDVEEKITACDPDIIERIMLNLLSNAVKYGKDNGTILVNIYDCENNIKISVKDDGIGISSDKQKKIFQRFVQINSTFTKIKEGNGIGLSLVKSFVEMSNGEIELISEVGKGSEFIISLPAYTINSGKNTLNMDTNLENIQNVKVEFSDIHS